jgi:hypothetical protein
MAQKMAVLPVVAVVNRRSQGSIVITVTGYRLDYH